MNRREMLQALAAFAMWPLQDDEELVDFADLRGFRTELRDANPRAKLFDLRRLTSLITPEDEFYTFHQTQTIHAEIEKWRLRIGGLVERPREFTLDQLKQRLDKREEAVTLECSGNSGSSAANGLISNGVWSGVGLASILKEAGLKPEAREVAFFGMDVEQERGAEYAAPHGRSVYVQDALDPKAMLAYSLNGKPLSAEQGFPLRVILPGWFGMTQVKWLMRIEVLDRRYEGSQMSRNYHTYSRIETPEQEIVIESSISKTRLKSVVARVTRRKQVYKISGAAWGGSIPIKSVEVKIDDAPWRPARIDRRGGEFSWLLWSLEWNDVTRGEHEIVSRAIDSEGHIQPTADEWRKTIKSARENNSQWSRKLVIT